MRDTRVFPVKEVILGILDCVLLKKRKEGIRFAGIPQGIIPRRPGREAAERYLRSYRGMGGDGGMGPRGR